MSRTMRCLAAAILTTACVLAGAPEGSRPYELDWAGRMADDHPPLVDFEHPGFLIRQGGWRYTRRSYYLLQQLHSRYTQGNALSIADADDQGRLLSTEQALASGAYRRNQVISEYDNGCVTVVNGSRDENLRTSVSGRPIELPTNGYAGWTDDGAVDVFNGRVNGHRADLAVTPAYTYVDGCGRFVRSAAAAGNGVGICRHLDAGGHELILYEDSDCGFALEGGDGQYATFAMVNEIHIGPTQSAHGAPASGVWAEDCRVALTPEAIASLDYRNTCGIVNPGGRDWFNVRRFWLGLELADGRHCSSTMALGAYAQPPNWPYAGVSAFLMVKRSRFRFGSVLTSSPDRPRRVARQRFVRQLGNPLATGATG